MVTTKVSKPSSLSKSSNIDDSSASELVTGTDSHQYEDW